jgi:hypothetical protein
MNAVRLTLFVLTIGFIGAAHAQAVGYGQLDNFQDGTTFGWSEGAVSPNPPTNVANGGPLGSGDRYLQNVSAGGFGAGSRLVEFNQLQWAGDYSAAGVTAIEADVINLGPTTLNIRLALGGGAFATHYGSTAAISLPSGGSWQSVAFSLSPAGLSLISGSDSLNTVLSGVTELRLLTAAAGPAWEGDAIAGILGVDNIHAVPEPDGLFLVGLGGAALIRRMGVR